MRKDKLRGHDIIFVCGEWLYEDTKEPTAGHERECGHCGKTNTPEGHDGCIGTLPNVMNACCGHGQDDESYIQYYNGSDIRGEAAKLIMRQEQIKKDMHKANLKPGMCGYMYVGDDNKLYMWEETTPLWRMLINSLEIFGVHQEYKPGCMGAL